MARSLSGWIRSRGYTHEKARAVWDTGGVCSIQFAHLGLLPSRLLAVHLSPDSPRRPDRLGGWLRAFPSLAEPRSDGMPRSSSCRLLASWRRQPAPGSWIGDLSGEQRNGAVDSSCVGSPAEQFHQLLLGGGGAHSAHLACCHRCIYKRPPRPMVGS